MLSKIVESAGTFVATERVIPDIHLNPDFFVNLVKLGLWSLFPLDLLSHLFMLLNHRPSIQLPSIHRSEWVVTNFSITLSYIFFSAYFFYLFIDLVQLCESVNQLTSVYRSRPCLIFVLLTTLISIFEVNVFRLQVQPYHLGFLRFCLNFGMVFTVPELQRRLSWSVPVSLFLRGVDLLQFFRNIHGCCLFLSRI